MNSDSNKNILKAHTKLEEVLRSIKAYPSNDKNVVFRDRAEKVLIAFVDYLIATSTSDDETPHVLHQLALALHDADNGYNNPLLAPNKQQHKEGGRPINTSTHHRRGVVLASVKYLQKIGTATSMANAVKILSENSGISLKTLNSDLNKAIHEVNLNVLDPEKITIPSHADIKKLASYISQLYAT